jgi:hypothetical protein
MEQILQMHKQAKKKKMEMEKYLIINENQQNAQIIYIFTINDDSQK